MYSNRIALPCSVFILSCLGPESQILGNFLGTKQTPSGTNLKAPVWRPHGRSAECVGIETLRLHPIGWGERGWGIRETEREEEGGLCTGCCVEVFQ